MTTRITTLRFLFILFLLLDVLAFAASRGMFSDDDPRPGATTPNRADKQIRPDNIQILGQTPVAPPPVVTINLSPAPPAGTTTPPPAPAPEAPECMAWSDLSTAQNNRLVTLLAAANIKAVARDVEGPPAWRVRIPALPSRAAAEQMVPDLIARDIDPDSILIESSGPNQSSITLGYFDNKADARRRLDAMKAKGIPNIQIEARNASERRIEATASPAAAEAALAGQPFATQHRPCRR
jgi:hypothetical protein